MKLSRNEARKIRKQRIKKKIRGNQDTPRLVVNKSNKFIYVQIIDDYTGNTLSSASSAQLENSKVMNLETCKIVGQKVAEIARRKNIQNVVFDRNGYKYHGRIKALAEGARENGLKF
jgi:large subunit ribosomal protein L18